MEVGQTRAIAEAMQYLAAQRQGLGSQRQPVYPPSTSSSATSSSQSYTASATVVDLYELVQQLQSRWDRLGLDGMPLRGVATTHLLLHLSFSSSPPSPLLSSLHLLFLIFSFCSLLTLPYPPPSVTLSCHNSSLPQPLPIPS